MTVTRRLLGGLLVAATAAASLAAAPLAGSAGAAWSPGSATGVAGARADDLGRGPTPVATAIPLPGRPGHVTISFAAGTTAGGTARSAFRLTRHGAGSSGATALDAACAPAERGQVTCVDDAPTGTWTYTATPLLAGSRWTGQEGDASLPVTVDATGPTVAITAPSGTTSSPATWPGTVTGTAADAGQGVDHVEVSVERVGSGCWTGRGTGWTAGCPGWLPATGTTAWQLTLPAEALGADGTFRILARATDALGTATTTSPLIVTYDTTPPATPTITYAGGAGRAGPAVITFTTGTDPSGIDAAATRLQRADAPLSDGACGPFGGWADLAGLTAPVTSPALDTGVASGGCYRYRLLVADGAGNVAVASSDATIALDADPPTFSSPALAVSTSGGAAATGATLYVRPGAAGSATVRAEATDALTGLASVTFPALAGAAGGGATTTAPFESAYSWTSLTATGTYDVTAEDHAGLTASTVLTVTPDGTGPSGTAITYPSRAVAGTSVTLSITAGTDAGAGLATGVTVGRATATASNGSCGTFGPYTTVATDPGPTATDTVAAGTCARYRLVVADRVGNTTTATGPDLVPATTLTSVTMANGAGRTAGRMDPTDTITFQLSGRLRVATLCSTWSGDATARTLTNVTVTVTGVTGGDRISFSSSTCTLGLGTIVVANTGLVSGTVTFTGSTLAWDPTDNVVRVTLGSNRPGGRGTIGPTTATYTPGASLRDTYGSALVPTTYDLSGVRF